MINIGRVRKPIDFFENIYVGRGSPLGNPAYLGVNQTRDEACDYYDVYIDEQMLNSSSPVFKEITRIKKLIDEGLDINLECYCAPYRCHAESIKRVLEQ